LDFDILNQKFTKIEITNENNKYEKYDKNNFFDQISNSTTEKTRETLEDKKHQFQLDKETFGDDYIKANSNFNMNR
jgi:hypothetical protein